MLQCAVWIVFGFVFISIFCRQRRNSRLGLAAFIWGSFVTGRRCQSKVRPKVKYSICTKKYVQYSFLSKVKQFYVVFQRWNARKCSTAARQSVASLVRRTATAKWGRYIQHSQKWFSQLKMGNLVYVACSVIEMLHEYMLVDGWDIPVRFQETITLAQFNDVLINRSVSREQCLRVLQKILTSDCFA